MTCSVPLSIRCTEIASDWYFLVRKVNILHESIGWKLFSKGIVSFMTIGVQAAPLAAAQLEKVRNHCLDTEQRMYSIQRKIKSLAGDLDTLTDELASAQARLYNNEPHTIPATLAGQDIDMTLSMFATQLFVMESPNPSIQIARSYEAVCLRAYKLPASPTGTKGGKDFRDRLAENSPSYANVREAASKARQQEPSTGKEVTAHLASCAVGVALAPTTFGLSLIAPLYTQFRLNRIHSKKYQ